MVLLFGFHPGPSHVPSSDRHTLPVLYRLGLNRTVPPPVVMKCTLGLVDAYAGGQYRWNRKQPLSYGVSDGPVMRNCMMYGRVAS